MIEPNRTTATIRSPTHIVHIRNTLCMIAACYTSKSKNSNDILCYKNGLRILRVANPWAIYVCRVFGFLFPYCEDICFRVWIVECRLFPYCKIQFEKSPRWVNSERLRERAHRMQYSLVAARTLSQSSNDAYMFEEAWNVFGMKETLARQSAAREKKKNENKRKTAPNNIYIYQAWASRKWWFRVWTEKEEEKGEEEAAEEAGGKSKKQNGYKYERKQEAEWKATAKETHATPVLLVNNEKNNPHRISTTKQQRKKIKSGEMEWEWAKTSVHTEYNLKHNKSHIFTKSMKWSSSNMDVVVRTARAIRLTAQHSARLVSNRKKPDIQSNCWLDLLVCVRTRNVPARQSMSFCWCGCIQYEFCSSPKRIPWNQWDILVRLVATISIWMGRFSLSKTPTSFRHSKPICWLLLLLLVSSFYQSLIYSKPSPKSLSIIS